MAEQTIGLHLVKIINEELGIVIWVVVGYRAGKRIAMEAHPATGLPRISEEKFKEDYAGDLEMISAFDERLEKIIEEKRAYVANSKPVQVVEHPKPKTIGERVDMVLDRFRAKRGKRRY